MIELPRLLSIVCLALIASVSLPLPAAETERIELIQRPEVMTAQQRIVGNLRAVAMTDGIVVRVPQLYVYYTDYSAAYHLQGVRSGFERRLNLIIDRQRRERSMVPLDRLLERTFTPAGEPYLIEDLPEADLYVLLYSRSGCEECEQVSRALDQWIAEQSDRDVVRLDVRTDATPN
jgi:hypothetical protein